MFIPSDIAAIAEKIDASIEYSPERIYEYLHDGVDEGDGPAFYDALTTLYSFCHYRYCREQIRKESPELEVVHNDIFFWRRTGTSADVSASRIGGAPYRPADAPWPISRAGEFAGEPMEFLGQLCFADSKDRFSIQLPGDVLLFFSDCRTGISSGTLEEQYFEWQPLGLKTITQASQVPGQVPTRKGPTSEFFTSRFPYWDLPKTRQSIEAICRFWSRTTGLPTEQTYDLVKSRLCSSKAIKIAGVPSVFGNEREWDGCTFLGSMCQIWPAPGPFPSLDREEPWEDFEVDAIKNFTVRDGFCLDLWLRPEGTIDYDINFD
jgi:hypothetical protein